MLTVGSLAAKDGGAPSGNRQPSESSVFGDRPVGFAEGRGGFGESAKFCSGEGGGNANFFKGPPPPAPDQRDAISPKPAIRVAFA